MATSDGLDGCLQRGRSQSDPNILTEPGIDLAHGTGKIDASLSFYIYLLYAQNMCFYVAAFLGLHWSQLVQWDVRAPRDN